ncbi:MAG: transcriptional regulator [SAR86 cluster bacterium]|uniref:Transcriptional regulator n=1 Tax=SAR86 cluster bacterium TaxID=2030880 RepID=A0A2A4MI91_9GAMM|nr:MAG: transcriptional regulator [SAR86 cluster bacterium]
MSTILETSLLNLFGKRLKKERERLKLTQQEFAEIGGVKRASQYLYENSGRPPTSDYIARIAEAGVDLSYLFSGNRTASTGGMLKLDPASAEKVLAMVDSYCRDGKGRLFDIEFRIPLTIAVFKALSEQKNNEINWEDLPEMMDRLSA